MSLGLLELTLRVAIVATLINLPVALAVSWLLVKRSFRGQFILDVLVSLPLAIPPVAIGFFLLLVLGIGILAAKAMEALGRNPEAAGQIQQNMILAIAFAEAIAIYALVVAIIIKFV